MKSIFFMLPLLIISFSSASEGPKQGKISGYIKNITIKETGYILIQYEENHTNPFQCLQYNALAISPTHIASKEIFSLALTAHASHKKAVFYVASCYEAYSTSYPLVVTGGILDK